MIEETAKEIKKGTPPVQSVGLLATSGTCQAGVYDKVFEQYGINLLKPTPNLQDLVMRLIYYIKSDGSSTYDPSEIRIVLESLKQAGAETYILGCTELPVAFEMLDICEATIDPTEIIAKSAIRFVGKNI
jgi:aspartate racemase